MAIRVWFFLTSLALVAAESDLRAIYIFGDSTADVGTNNYLNDSRARADKLFNGIDFPHSQPTGRFSNGYNTIDMLVRLLDANYRRSPPSFLSLLDNIATFQRNLVNGANFASGGSGILNDTGNKLFGRVIPLADQIQQFSTVTANLTELLGPDKAQSLISNSIYILSVGGNDIFEFQLFGNGTSAEAFMTYLLDEYRTHLKDLYQLGARKFGVISVPPIGCCPLERFLNGTDALCSEDMNALARTFYTLIEALLRDCSQIMKGMKYSLGNAYDMTMFMIDNSLTFGFKEVKTACCGNGTLNAEAWCTQEGNLCRNRDDYLFWDRVHPTQAAAKLAALTLYGGGLEFLTPMNFSQLTLVDAP